MIVRDISFQSPQENILFDEVLWSLAESGQGEACLRFWESSVYFIVLGRIGKPEQDIDLIAAQKDQIPVLRRASGGGTVVQGPGCLNYSLILPKNLDAKLPDIRKSYDFILNKVVKVISQFGCPCQYFPISDIALLDSEKKFSGNAQKRGRHFILHHGTILYDFDLNQIPQYLKMPKDIPSYRQNRPHTDFVSNIPISVIEFKRLMAQEFSAIQTIDQVFGLENQLLQQFLTRKLP
ncbi:MAG: lipoate--protein ligase family protein [Candidatus Omnitrophica bacterium]|nr:lipoate--protein ligase family protein [Candidatus Omnitrophota bacterium]